MLAPDFKTVMVAAASLTLFGCVVPQRAATPPIPTLSPSGPFTVPRTALAGQTTRIDFATSINPDCTVRGIPTVRILTQPVHGTIATSEMDDFSSYPLANPRSACNKSKSRGIRVDYTPVPGYTGPDYLSYELISAEGADKTFNIPLTVK